MSPQESVFALTETYSEMLETAMLSAYSVEKPLRITVL